MVSLLLECPNIDPDLCDSLGGTLFHVLGCTGRPSNPENIRLLIEDGRFPLNAKDGTGQTPLVKAARQGDPVIVEALLKADQVDITARDNLGRTALMTCICNGERSLGSSGKDLPDIIRLLLDTGKFNVTQCSEEQDSPLVAAEKQRHKGAAHEEIYRIVQAYAENEMEVEEAE